MKFQDDRTPEQRNTHTWLVGGTDRCLSGWGAATGGMFYAFWACEYKDLESVEKWVRSRTDMMRVRVVGKGYRPKGVGHCHVYVVTEGHNALQAETVQS